LQKSDAAQAFKDAADEVDDAFFLLTSEKAVKEKFEAKKDGEIIAFKKFDELKVVYAEEERTSEVGTAFSFCSIQFCRDMSIHKVVPFTK
jgi:hypothetical protein